MRLPTKLAFTAFHVAVAGTLACSAATDHGTELVADSGADVPTRDGATQDVAPMEASIVDAVADVPSEAGDECAANYFCGPVMPDAACPGPVCDLSECPLDAGCGPFV